MLILLKKSVMRFNDNEEERREVGEFKYLDWQMTRGK